MTNIDDILARPYTRILVPAEEGGYTASVLELDGCIAEGDTANEAMSELAGAMRDWVEAAVREGQSIPAPFAAREFSGRTLVRMPRSLHERATRQAAIEGVSLNALLVTAIAYHLGVESRPSDTLRDRFKGRVRVEATPEQLYSTGETWEAS